jgi:hypothetical protein
MYLSTGVFFAARAGVTHNEERNAALNEGSKTTSHALHLLKTSCVREVLAGLDVLRKLPAQRAPVVGQTRNSKRRACADGRIDYRI